MHSNHSHTDYSDAIWLWTNAAIFAIVTVFSDVVPYDVKTGLASALIVDCVGAIVVLYVYFRFDFTNSVFDLLLAGSFLGLLLIGLFQFLGQNLYAAFAVAAVLRHAYDLYHLANTHFANDTNHAKNYFITFLQGSIPFAYFMAFVLFASGHKFAKDEHFSACESAICRATSPPDAYLIFGLFLFPLLAGLTSYWRPRWMRWVPLPKHVRSRQ